MFEELKKRSIKKALPGGIIAILIGVILLGIFCGDVLTILRGVHSYDDMTTADIEKVKGKLLVEATIDLNYGNFMEKYEENTKTGVTRTTDLYYIILDYDMVDYRYMALRMPPAYRRQMDAIEEATYEDVTCDPIVVTGVLRKMNSKEMEYFKDYFLESDFTEEEFNAESIPYIIDEGALVNGSEVPVWLMVGLGVLCIIGGIVIIVIAAVGGDLKKFKKDIANAKISEHQLESDFASAKTFDKSGSVRIGRLGTYIMTTSIPRFLSNEQIVWAYQITTTHRTNGIKTGTSYSLNIFTYDRKCQSVAMPNEETSIAVLEYIGGNIPWAMLGYSEDLKKTFQKDYDTFLNYKYNKIDRASIIAGFEMREAEAQSVAASMGDENSMDLGDGLGDMNISADAIDSASTVGMEGLNTNGEDSEAAKEEDDLSALLEGLEIPDVVEVGSGDNQ